MCNSPIAVRDAYTGRHVLLTGATGFLGKVWLAMALEQLPAVGRLWVLVRPGAQVTARRRFENTVNSSPAFAGLHARFGPGLSRYIAERVEVVEGDLARPSLGMDPETASRLSRDVDLIVHCAGQVDFNPDFRKALAANVDATLNLAEFAERCDRAALLHVSTCYVAGVRQGRIEELLHETPALQNGLFDPEQELAEAWAATERIRLEQESQEVQQALQADLDRLLRQRPENGNSDRFQKSYTRRWLREWLRREMAAEGRRRAEHWGWQNTYTYSKGLAELLLTSRARQLRYSIVRPSIVESALEFPFPGWNQGFNASAPLAYLLGTWFHMLPAKRDVPFDVIPVDMVCRALIQVGAALMLDRHRPIYHLGTSDRNRFTLGRACELTDLGHRRHLRGKGKTTLQRVLLSRWDAKVVDAENLLSVGNARRVVRGFGELLDDSPEIVKKRIGRLRNKLSRTDKKLREIDDLLEMFLPFVHDNYQVFACGALDAHPPVESEFRFTPESIDWRHYWIEVHMPGLRRWIFPRFEGKPRELFRPEFPVRLPDERRSPASKEAVASVGAHAQWEI